MAVTAEGVVAEAATRKEIGSRATTASAKEVAIPTRSGSRTEMESESTTVRWLPCQPASELQPALAWAWVLGEAASESARGSP